MTTSPAPPTSDTPAHFRPVQASSVPNSTLEPEEMCEAQDDVLHKKTEVSLYNFIEISLPSLSEHLNVTDVLQHMLSLEAWKEFSYSLSPSTHRDDDNIVAEKLSRFFVKMVNAAQCVWKERCPEQRWSLKTIVPNAAPNSPDAFLYCQECSGSEPHSGSWYNLAFTVESECAKIRHCIYTVKSSFKV